MIGIDEALLPERRSIRYRVELYSISLVRRRSILQADTNIGHICAQSNQYSRS